jgi:hypothetical protein
MYYASDQDTSNAVYHYFGYLSVDGLWIIQRFEIGAGTIAYRYVSGTTGYAAAWAVRDTGALSYDYFDTIAKI